MCLDGRHGLDDSHRDRWSGALVGDSPTVPALEGRQASRQDVGRRGQGQRRFPPLERGKTCGSLDHATSQVDRSITRLGDGYRKEAKDALPLG